MKRIHVWATWDGELGSPNFANLSLHHEIVEVSTKEESEEVLRNRRMFDDNIGCVKEGPPRLGEDSELNGTAEAMKENMEHELHLLHEFGTNPLAPPPVGGLEILEE